MNMDTGLNTAVLDAITRVLSRFHEIESVSLYGSRAKGTYKERSDIDMVAFGDQISSETLSLVLLELDETDIPYQMELQNYSDLKNTRLRDHIKRGGINLYQRGKPSG